MASATIMDESKPKLSQFEFVVGNRPDQLNGGTSRKVRSYVSKRAWQAHAEQTGRPLGPSRQSSSSARAAAADRLSTTAAAAAEGQNDARAAARKARRTKTRYRVVFECVTESSNDQPGDTDEMSTSTALVPVSTWPTGLTTQVQQSQTSTISLERQLGGGRIDPFRSFPGPWKTFIPAVVDHYIIHMAVDIPELDQQGGKGLLRSSWFPLVVSELSTFQTVLLLAACNFVTIKSADVLQCDLLQLKVNAITSINKAMGDRKKMLSDGVIGAVAKMASFEAMHGDVESYQMHMEGLKRMVDMRGGMSALGLNGLLRRMIVWIDLNSSFLLQIPRYFPGHQFAYELVQEPNPARFIAV